MKKTLIFIAKLCLTALILFFVLRQISFSEYKTALSLLTPKVLVFLVLTVILQICVLAYRWCYITHLSTDKKFTFGASLVGILISFFFSQGLPASIGGDAFRVWWITKRGVSTNNAMQTIFYDRIYGLVSLVLACMVSVTLYLLFIGNKSSQLLSLLLAVIAAGLLLFLFMMPARFGFSKYLLKAVSHLPNWVTGLMHWGLQTRESLNAQSFTKSLILVGTSLFTHAIVVIQAYIIGRLLSPGEVTFLICILAVPPALFVSYMPFSIAGWGVRETSMVMAFGLFGIKAATPLIMSLTIGMAVLATSLIGGLFWLLEWKNKHRQDLEIVQSKARSG